MCNDVVTCACSTPMPVCVLSFANPFRCFFHLSHCIPPALCICDVFVYVTVTVYVMAVAAVSIQLCARLLFMCTSTHTLLNVVSFSPLPPRPPSAVYVVLVVVSCTFVGVGSRVCVYVFVCPTRCVAMLYVLYIQ